MAPARLQFDMSLHPAGSRGARRADDSPMRLLLLADLGGDRSVPLAARKPLAVDIDSFDRVLARVAPRLEVEVAGQRVALSFASLEDFHPDRLFERLPLFGTLRQLRDEARDPTQFRRVAAALGVAAPAPAAPPAAAAAPADAAGDIERLLGRAPSATPAAPPAAAGPASMIDRWVREQVAPHATPDTAQEQRALLAAIDAALTALMRSLLHAPAFQALEAAWLGADRLVRGLELGESLTLSLLDVSRAELMADLAGHRADLSTSALHAQLAPGAGVDAPRWGLVAVDHAFGPDANDVQALAALGALGARIGAPVLAGATPAVVGADAVADLAEPRRWRHDDDEETFAYWQALREAPMAPWLGLVLPRVLMRLPYGAGSDPITRFAFEEMSPERPHTDYCWGGGAPALALLVGRAFLEDGWSLDLGRAIDLDDLPSHVYADDGARHQQPGAELLMSEEAAEAVLARGPMLLLSWRDRNAARVMRWQSVASPARALAGLGTS